MKKYSGKKIDNGLDGSSLVAIDKTIIEWLFQERKSINNFKNGFKTKVGN